MNFSKLLHIVRIAIVTALFFILIAEGMLRVFGPTSVDECGLFILDSTNHFALRPNYSTRLFSSEYNIQVVTNSLGHRAPELAVENTERILFLGDSFTFGLGVEEQDAFPQLTKRYLSIANKSVVIYNAGVIGHGTIHEYNELLRIAPIVKPNLIVLGYFANDPADNDAFSEFDVYEGCLVLRNEPNKWLKNNLRRHFQSYNFFSHVLRGFFPSNTSVVVDTSKTLHWMRKIANYSTSIDAKLIIVLIPTGQGVTWLENTDLSEFHVINLQETLKQQDYFAWDGHLKPEGHKLVAQAIANELVK